MNKLPQRQVHLDFHTSEHIDNIGSEFDKEQFKRCLKKGHVNSITIFAKCHHGWAYFPSKTNKMHPGLHFDLLSEMYEACKEAGVAAPIYLSAGHDQRYAVEHPDELHHWTRDFQAPPVKEYNGFKYFDRPSATYDLLCFNTPYLDVLKAQVAEVVEKYMPEGIFLDIILAPQPCYCKYCTAGMIELGLDPDSDSDRLAFAEKTYKKYVDTINGAATAIKPDIRIFHNGGHVVCGRRDLASADTHYELESLPTGGWGYDHFPKSAKYIAHLGKEYLGMTGKFHLSWGEFGGFKHPNALRYEVALSMANGAKMSVGDQMHPYGFLDEATYELIGKAYSYAETVEEYCYDVESVADIGLLSNEAVTGVRNTSPEVGACRILLEGNYLYDVIDTECDFSKYKLIILADNIKPAGELADKLRQFTANGGKVLCTGESGTDENGEFIFDLGVKFCGKSDFKPSYYRPNYNALGLSPTSYVMYSNMYNTQLTDDSAKILGSSRNSFFNRSPEHYCSHRHTPFVNEDNAPAAVVGKDGGYIAFELFGEYADVGSIILKDTVITVIDEILGTNKTLKTNLPAQGVVTLMNQKDNNRHVLHSLYASPVKRGKNVDIIEDLMPVYNTSFEIAMPENVTAVKTVPENKNIRFEYSDGILKFKIDEFVCNAMVVIEH